MVWYILQGAVPKGNATRENIMKLGLKEGQVVFKCPKCISIKPDRAHHCRYGSEILKITNQLTIYCHIYDVGHYKNGFH